MEHSMNTFMAGAEFFNPLISIVKQQYIVLGKEYSSEAVPDPKQIKISVEFIFTTMIFQTSFVVLSSLIYLISNIPSTVATPHSPELLRRAPCDGQVCGSACCD